MLENSAPGKAAAGDTPAVWVRAAPPPSAHPRKQARRRTGSGPHPEDELEGEGVEIREEDDKVEQQHSLHPDTKEASASGLAVGTQALLSASRDLSPISIRAFARAVGTHVLLSASRDLSPISIRAFARAVGTHVLLSASRDLISPQTEGAFYERFGGGHSSYLIII